MVTCHKGVCVTCQKHCVSHVTRLCGHMSQCCVVTCQQHSGHMSMALCVTCQKHCVSHVNSIVCHMSTSLWSHVNSIVCHMSKALCVTCHNGRVTECMDLRCRVTECMNGSSVDEWFLNNYEMVMDE